AGLQRVCFTLLLNPGPLPRDTHSQGPQKYQQEAAQNRQSKLGNRCRNGLHLWLFAVLPALAAVFIVGRLRQWLPAQVRREWSLAGQVFCGESLDVAARVS